MRPFLSGLESLSCYTSNMPKQHHSNLLGWKMRTAIVDLSTNIAHNVSKIVFSISQRIKINKRGELAALCSRASENWLLQSVETTKDMFYVWIETVIFLV